MIQFYKSISGLWQSWTTDLKHDSVFQDQNRSVPRLKYKFFHRHVKHCYSRWIFWETKWNHTCYMSVFKPCETDMNQDSVTDMCATRDANRKQMSLLLGFTNWKQICPVSEIQIGNRMPFYKSKSGLWQSWTTDLKQDSVLQV